MDEHSYAKIGDGEAIYEDVFHFIFSISWSIQIIDVITVDGDVDLGQNGNSFKMDEDVEEIHEIIGEDGVEEIIIPVCFFVSLLLYCNLLYLLFVLR